MKQPNRQEDIKAVIAAGILANPSNHSQVCWLGELTVDEKVEKQMKWLCRSVERVYSIIQDRYQEDA